MVKLNIKTRQCEDGIITEYLSYSEGQESPTNYHKWVCYSIIAQALGRSVKTDFQHWDIFPNIYTILVGPSGYTHKSTALNMGVKLLRRACNDKLAFCDSKLTPAYLGHFLTNVYTDTGKAEGIAIGSELSNLLGQTQLDDSLIKLLTDLYDCPEFWSTGTIVRGSEPCNNACLNLLGGSTVDWLHNSLPEASLGGGFFSRLLLIYELEPRHKSSKPDYGDPVLWAETRARIVNDLAIVNTLKGVYIFSPEAWNVYDTWYMEQNHPHLQTKYLQGYFVRKGPTITKLAMIYMASHSNELVLTPDSIYFAINELDKIEVGMNKLIDQLGSNEDGKKLAYVKSSIHNYFNQFSSKEVSLDSLAIPHSVLLRRVSNRFNAETLATVMTTLEQSEQILGVYILSQKSSKRLRYYTTPEKLKVLERESLTVQ